MWLFCIGEHSQHGVMCSYHGEGVWSFVFLYVQFIFHYVLQAFNCACLGTLQYWLFGLIVCGNKFIFTSTYQQHSFCCSENLLNN